MIVIAATRGMIRELEDLKIAGSLHSWRHEFWERLADYTEANPRWLFYRGTKYDWDHPYADPFWSGRPPRIFDIRFQEVNRRKDIEILEFDVPQTKSILPELNRGWLN